MADIIISLLLVEDSESDAALLLAELKRAKFQVAHRRVETKADYLTAMQNQSWDAVISDYVLPQFSGPEALCLLRESGNDLPFIMVSGIYGEDTAVTAMKAGANDYVMKGNLSRLAPALERELVAVGERRSRRRAEGAKQFLASIVESSADAIYGMNLDNIIVSWNPSAESLFGYCAEEIIGRSAAVLFPKSRTAEMIEIMDRIRGGEALVERETDRLHKNESLISVSVTISPVRNSAGEIIGASAVNRDLMRQKLADAERRHLIKSLTASAQEVRALTGLLPICAKCKRIRDDRGYWQQVGPIEGC